MSARRVVGALAGVALALAAAGALYQTVGVRRDAIRFPPPGRLVDIGGRRLHLLCIGDGQPTVVFESSAFSSSVSFAAARAEIGTRARVCSYDRMGTGWSDPGPARVSVGVLTDDLERLLERAAIRGPYILVPASMGGLVAEMYARRHPDRIAGLVFVDAGHSGVVDYVAPRVTWTIRAAACLPKTAARFGLLRLFDPLGLRRQPGADDAIWRLYRVEPMATLCALVSNVAVTVREFAAAPPLAGDVPLTVLTAETTDGLLPPGYGSEGAVLARDWRALQQALSRRSSRGTWRIVPGSNHLIGNSQPHVVASAVLDMLARVPPVALH